MTTATEQVEYLLNQKYSGRWHCEITDMLWLVEDDSAYLVLACPNGEYLRVGSLIGSSANAASVYAYAAQANKDYEQGRIFVDQGQPGTHCLVVEDHISEQTLEADNSLLLLWQKLIHLANSVRSARESAGQLDGFDLMDPTVEGFGILTLGFI